MAKQKAFEEWDKKTAKKICVKALKAWNRLRGKDRVRILQLNQRQRQKRLLLLSGIVARISEPSTKIQKLTLGNWEELQALQYWNLVMVVRQDPKKIMIDRLDPEFLD